MAISPPADPGSSETYLEWVRANAPSQEKDAEVLVADLGDAARYAFNKPGRFLDSMRATARRLPVEHLPWFWDTVGHRLIRHGRAPRHAATAYTLAREAEQTNGLAVDRDYHLDNTLLFARRGALGGKEAGVHQRWLASVFPAEQAHAEFVRFVRAWSAGPTALPADLHARVRTSAKAAGLGVEEDARVLGEALAAAKGTAVPGALLDGAARVFAQSAPAAELHARLADMFPATDNGAPWLRMLDAAGVIEAMAAGWVEPSGGLHGWLGAFVYNFSYSKNMAQQMPDELYGALSRLAPRMRGTGAPVRLHEQRHRRSNFDAELVDACLAEGVPVEDPGPRVRLQFWSGAPRRDFAALAADPVLGPRLEGTVHAQQRQGTAVTRLPHTPGIEASVHTRLTRLLDEVAEGGLGSAHAAMGHLDTGLDLATATALDGIEEALAGLDLSGPLLRTLRSGLPAELGWPAMEEAVAELTAGGADRSTGTDDTGTAPGRWKLPEAPFGSTIEGVTSTWPVLTLFTRTAAIAVDHQGRRGSCTFSLPDDAAMNTVHYVGGDFLVGWSTSENFATSAFWAGTPDEVFAPENVRGLTPLVESLDGGLGYQFATPDGGRHDGERVLRPGGREGIGTFELQLTDGTRVWSTEYSSRRRPWAEVDPVTGTRAETGSLPDLFAEGRPKDWDWTSTELSLVRLPEGVDSPLGQVDGLSGFRVSQPPGFRDRYPDDQVIEGVDGRRAEAHRKKGSGAHGHPWGIVRLPAGGPDLVATHGASSRRSGVMGCHAADDGSLLWEVRSFPSRKRGIYVDPAAPPIYPPPAFWHFMAPRDLASSRALRAADADAARALLAAALPGTDGPGATRAAVRAAVARVLPGVTDPLVTEDVVAAVLRARTVLRLREKVSRRVAVVRSGELVRAADAVSDTALVESLLGLLHPRGRSAASVDPRSPLPATITAVVADGRYFHGDISDDVRRLSPPKTPLDWTILLGRIDAAAWRLVCGFTDDAERAALTGLLRAWAGQPFAAPGTWRLGRATGAALAPLCASGRAIVVGHPNGITPEGFVAPVTGGPDPLAAENTYRFLQPESAPPPAEATETRTVTVERDDAARLTRLLDLVAERGPLPLDKDALAAFTRRTGVRRSVAALVLSGLPRRADFGGDLTTRWDAHWRMMRSKPFLADKSISREVEDLTAKLGLDGRYRLLAAAMPDDPAELWEPGGPVAAAERMAEVWLTRFAARPAVDEEVLQAVENDLGQGEHSVLALADPASSDIAASEVRHVLLRTRNGGLELRRAAPDGTPGERAHGQPFAGLASLLVWALTERPVGDPAVAGAAELHDRMRARVADPGLLVPLGSAPVGGDAEYRARLFGPGTFAVLPTDPALPPEVPFVYDDGLLLVDGSSDSMHLRPAGFAEPGAYERAVRTCEDHGMVELLRRLRRARACYDDALTRMVRRAAATPVPVGGYEANPQLSVPALVEEVADTLGCGPDAAALYLQLCTLARPTDRNVRAWNGWTPARHKAAQKELVGLGAVEEGKRTRAGRTVFVPGAWLEPKAPEVPLEAAKADTHLATVLHKGGVIGPFTRLLPPRPLHEMFAEAWAAR